MEKQYTKGEGSRAKLRINFSKNMLVATIIFAWIFSGWPQIFDFPPGVQIVQATASTPTIAGTGANDATVGTQESK